MADTGIETDARGSLWPPTWPMGLTMLRLLLLPVFLWALLIGSNQPTRSYWHMAVGVYVLMAVTDKLDGYLARRLGQTSRLGAILDPVADKLLIACSVMLLSLEFVAPRHFRIPAWVVATIYGKDLIIAIGTIALLSVVGTVRIAPRPLGKACTVLELAMVFAVLLAPDEKARWMPAWLVLVRILWWVVTIVAALACADYVIQGLRQFTASRRHPRAAGGAEKADGEAAADNSAEVSAAR